MEQGNQDGLGSNGKQDSNDSAACYPYQHQHNQDSQGSQHSQRNIPSGGGDEILSLLLGNYQHHQKGAPNKRQQQPVMNDVP